MLSWKILNRNTTFANIFSRMLQQSTFRESFLSRTIPNIRYTCRYLHNNYINIYMYTHKYTFIQTYVHIHNIHTHIHFHQDNIIWWRAIRSYRWPAFIYVCLYGSILASYHIVEEAEGMLPICTGDQYQSPIKLRIIINKEFHIDFNLPAFNTNIVGIESSRGGFLPI